MQTALANCLDDFEGLGEVKLIYSPCELAAFCRNDIGNTPKDRTHFDLTTVGITGNMISLPLLVVQFWELSSLIAIQTY